MSSSRRLLRLSARIFGDIARQVTPTEQRVIDRFAAKPWQAKVAQWYPPIDRFRSLLGKLRYHGLYRDEHLDFVYDMKMKRKARGKGPPEKGKGRKARTK